MNADCYVPLQIPRISLAGPYARINKIKSKCVMQCFLKKYHRNNSSEQSVTMFGDAGPAIISSTIQRYLEEVSLRLPLNEHNSNASLGNQTTQMLIRP